MIERRPYLEQLIAEKENGLIKMITGVAGCGKTYLLFQMYHQYLNSIGVDDKHIIELSLEDKENEKYRNPFKLEEYIDSLLVDKEGKYYIFLDEVTKIKAIKNPYRAGSKETIGFVEVLLGLWKKTNTDIYAISSNSKAVSEKLIPEFRHSIEEIKIYPLNYREFYEVFEGDKKDAWKEYCTYGGLPYVCLLKDDESKEEYLKNLFKDHYLKDITEWHNIRRPDTLDFTLDTLSSSIGTLTNAKRISTAFEESGKEPITPTAITGYLKDFASEFLISEARRYEIEKEKYMSTPLKYYYADIGLRNARLGFKNLEEGPIMEQIIYNELLSRGYTVDSGVVEYPCKSAIGNPSTTNLEVDFVASFLRRKKVCIQSVLSFEDDNEIAEKVQPFEPLTDDFFTKVVIVKDDIDPCYDEDGILYIGIKKFLLKPGAAF